MGGFGKVGGPCRDCGLDEANSRSVAKGSPLSIFLLPLGVGWEEQHRRQIVNEIKTRVNTFRVARNDIKARLTLENIGQMFLSNKTRLR